MAGNCYYYQRSFLEAVGEIRQMAIEMGMKPCDGNVLKRFFAENPVLKVGTILKDNEGNQYITSVCGDDWDVCGNVVVCKISEFK